MSNYCQLLIIFPRSPAKREKIKEKREERKEIFPLSSILYPPLPLRSPAPLPIPWGETSDKAFP